MYPLQQVLPRENKLKMSLRFKFSGWAVAIACSFFLNAMLFGLMPGLIQKGSGLAESMEDIRQVNVVRVRKPEPMPRKKELEKLKKKPLKQIAKSRTLVKQKPADLKPRLDFKLNPRLPAAPLDLAMPAVETFSMDVSLLKGHFTVGELDAPLTALVKIPPVYPGRAKRRGIQGSVTVEFLVTSQGLVDQVKVIKAEPEKIFNRSVINCVSRWKFRPGTVEGIPVPTLARTTIRFELEN